MADLHTHMIPGVDDGAPDLESALDALRALWNDGITAVAATPHLNASRLDGSRRTQVDETWPVLVAAVERELPGLKLRRGFEILLDTPEIDFSDRDLRIAGTRFVLVEFHAFTIPYGSARVLGTIRDSGYVPLLAHPERYVGYDREMKIVPEWREAGALMQLNGGSVLGESGDAVSNRAHRFLENGWVDLIASDNHARPRRSLSLLEVWSQLAGKGFAEQARALLSENPHRILRDELPLRVSPMKKDGGLISRISRAWRGR